MKKTTNLELTLYEATDRFSITGSEDSLNHNMEILDEALTNLPAGNVVTADGTVVSPNADFAEVAEWADGNPDNENRTGYFVCANVPVDGIIMKKATSTDDVKGVTIENPAFAGNYTADKLDSNGNLLPKYSFVAVIGFVPVIDNGTCEIGGRCMPDDNGCAIPSSNDMGYQVVNRIDENRVLIIIEPNGDMVQRLTEEMTQKQDYFADVVHPKYDTNTIELHTDKHMCLYAHGTDMIVDSAYLCVGPDDNAMLDINEYGRVDLSANGFYIDTRDGIALQTYGDGIFIESYNTGIAINGEDGVNINSYEGTVRIGYCSPEVEIKNVIDPVDDKDAVNKAYVDNAIGDIETALDNIITKYGLGGETE